MRHLDDIASYPCLIISSLPCTQTLQQAVWQVLKALLSQHEQAEGLSQVMQV